MCTSGMRRQSKGTDNNMVVAPSFQSAIKHRIGQSVKLPGDPPRADEISKDPEKRSERECNKREMRLLRFQAAPTLSEKLVSVAIVNNSKKKKKKNAKKKKEKKKKEERLELQRTNTKWLAQDEQGELHPMRKAEQPTKHNSISISNSNSNSNSKGELHSKRNSE